jgi:hypothetical protein
LTSKRPERKPFFFCLEVSLGDLGVNDEVDGFVDGFVGIELDEPEESELREGGNLGEGQKSDWSGDAGLDIVLADSASPELLRYESWGGRLPWSGGGPR